MGTRVISTSALVHGSASPVVTRQGHFHRVGPRVAQKPPGMPTLQVHYDGTAGKEGLATALGPDEAWIDPSTLFRTGTNLGITVAYEGGAGTCEIFGSSLPRDLLYRVNANDANSAAIVADAASEWISLGTVSPTANLKMEFGLYTMLRVKFAAGAGSLTLVSR